MYESSGAITQMMNRVLWVEKNLKQIQTSNFLSSSLAQVYSTSFVAGLAAVRSAVFSHSSKRE